ncbi:MAG TPA: ABC transporter substrate-binding protein [Candidatus Eisenbacteria bacterium]|nr:ABC transporter substrate-binding protein [Candidatus Eisenbacteria bacterium]
MKLTAAASLLVALAIAATFVFFPGCLEAAERAKEIPLTVRLDFIVGGNHAPWFVAREKGFYAKRGLNVTIQPGSGSADTIRTIAAGGADVGFANVSTAIVGRSRGTPIVVVAQLGYLAVTILWREDSAIETLKDLEGKSWAISPGQAQWFLLPALARINHINFKSIKVEETAPPLQPAALLAKKADFITMFRASNDEVAELAAARQGVRLKRMHMRDAGLDIYGSALVVREEDLKRRPEMIAAYVEGTMEGLRYTRDHQDEALRILLKVKPELDPELTRVQIKNGVEEVFIPAESLTSGFGYMKPDVMEKTVRITNEFFDVAAKVAPDSVYTNRFIRK